MDFTIINESKTFTLYGFSTVHDENKSYGEEIIALLNKIWPKVGDMKHTGVNHAVYDADNRLFAGIELISPEEGDSILEKREICFQKYAYCKHIGPYSKLGDTYNRFHSSIEALGQQHTFPLIEVYGHWNEDESKLETEIYSKLK
ncbi:GyrI-like domain-containing protein [Lederbergia citrea]|uniref:GyrI-like domain-containing protein n=1 Tax=Lederbergia citrea TaxID=2833581 RepID=A0A942UQZ8_9BACI|nr:GyrI-like domain-containing protein [Lederbergia citrea]MBS4206009.1 GyrI-like domain-containing protein [Lederbergia citrea]MBS4224542.1 GyrI-like domain-containing protein [Lederbergia citrea]